MGLSESFVFCEVTEDPSLPMPSQVSFQEDLTSAFQDVRASLRSLFDERGVDPSSLSDTARRLGVTRNLAWKLGKVLGEDDLYTAVQHLPGDEGITILEQAMRRAGATPDSLGSLRAALDRFDHVIQVHVGDRNTLSLILDGMGGINSGDRLKQSRKLAFRGNSGVWGLQARVRSTLSVIAPSAADPLLVDVATVGGLIDLRRLRPNIRWPLLRPRLYHDDGTPIEFASNEQPIEPTSDPSPAGRASPLLIREFCSANMPEIHAIRTRLGWDYELGDGPVGNLGAFTCFFGRIVRGASAAYRTTQDPLAELFSQVTLPVETMIFDVLVHRDFPHLMSPQVLLLSSPEGGGPGRAEQSIPLEARAVEISGRPPMLGTPQIPRYEELLARVFERGGWNMRDFRAIRLTIDYPPMHSVAVLRSELPPPPAA